jgi:hypothetical protein
MGFGTKAYGYRLNKIPISRRSVSDIDGEGYVDGVI